MPSDIYKTRFVRKLDDQKFDVAQLRAIEGLSWKPQPSKDDQVDVLPVKVFIENVTGDAPHDPAITSVPQVRRLYIKRSDVEKYGFSQGCPGCDAIRHARTAVAHTAGCIKRIGDNIKRDDPERQQQTDDRINEGIARHIEEQERTNRQL